MSRSPYASPELSALVPVRPDLASERPGTERLFEIPGWGTMGPVRRVKVLRELVEEYCKDPQLAVFVVGKVLAGRAPPREYQRQAALILRWVQQNVYYVNEPDERIQSPWKTIEWGLGDCFAEGTLVLRDDFRMVPIEDRSKIEGSRIWGLDGWVRVEAWSEKGELPVTEIDLNNGTTMNLTEDHRVLVIGCTKHGLTCKSVTSYGMCRKAGRITQTVETRVSELRPGMRILQPDRIDFGKGDPDPDLALMEGLYVADGWTNYYRPVGSIEERPTSFAISGQDGKPKEAQKARVAAICDRLGVNYSMSRKYIQVNDKAWAGKMAQCGRYAPTKRCTTLDLNEAAAGALLEGLMADSGKNTSGNGCTFSSTSRELALQFRLLNKMHGIDCSQRCLTDHGGLGNNPIYRVGVRGMPKALRVKEIRRKVKVARCYDIQTEDGHVYLPENDATVHNCDDQSLLINCMAAAIHLPNKFVLAGYGRGGKLVRWVEGEGKPPRNVQWVHIYSAIGWPPFTPRFWASAEPTMRDAPLGYDVVRDGAVGDPHGRLRVPRPGEQANSTMPELQSPLGTPGGLLGSLGALGSPEGSDQGDSPPKLLSGAFWRRALYAAVEGLPAAVISAVAIWYVTRQLEAQRLDDRKRGKT